jgi:hypothetical protein
VRHGQLEAEVHYARSEALRLREIGSSQWQAGKQALHERAEAYLARGEETVVQLRAQESAIVSQIGSAVAAEAQAFQQAMQQGHQVHRHLQEEEHVVSWMRHEAQQALAREHVVCASLRLEQSNAREELQQMARLAEVQWQRAEYRLWHDESRRSHRFDQARVERLRAASAQSGEELR